VDDDYFYELQALTQLNAFQLAVNVMPFDTRYARFIYKGLSSLSGITAVRVCLDLAKEPVGDEINTGCDDCVAFSRAGSEPLPGCLQFNKEEITVIPVRTGSWVFGYFAIRVAPDFPANTISAIRNFANFVATSIESERRKEELLERNAVLESYKNDLERLVRE